LRYVSLSFLVIMCRYLLGDSEKSYALQLITPASILAGLSGRKQIEKEDVSELFLDAKIFAAMIENGSFGTGSSLIRFLKYVQGGECLIRTLN
jgi:TIP49 AAA-lid domain